MSDWTETGIDESVCKELMGRWPLINAVIRGTLASVIDILSKVPEDNRKKVLAARGPNNNNALHYAAKNRKYDVCEYLLANGSEKDQCYLDILERYADDTAIKASREKAVREHQPSRMSYDAYSMERM